jgi:hypothetical protein
MVNKKEQVISENVHVSHCKNYYLPFTLSGGENRYYIIANNMKWQNRTKHLEILSK